MRFLFANDDRPYLAGTWVPARPIIPEVKFDAGPRFASEDASASEVLAQANDAFAAQRLQLVREGAADFVQSFRSGKAPTSRTTKEDR
jgi:type IV secretory pathway TrbL component